MASKVKPVDIDAEVLSFLKLALDIVRTDLGENYCIEKSQKELFFENISIKELEHKHKCFRPIKDADQKNETGTDFHVEKAPAIRTGSTGHEVQVKGGSESSFPTVMDFWKLSAKASGFMNKKSSGDYVECSQAIPGKAKLRRQKGYSTYVCKAEVSLRVPSQQIGFYVKKGLGRTGVKSVPALAVLSLLQGWDKLKGIAVVEVAYKVEATQNGIVVVKA